MYSPVDEVLDAAAFTTLLVGTGVWLIWVIRKLCERRKASSNSGEDSQ